MASLLTSQLDCKTEMENNGNSKPYLREQKLSYHMNSNENPASPLGQEVTGAVLRAQPHFCAERVSWVQGNVKLIDYIHRQRQCKLSVPLNDRTAELNSYPRFNDWLDIVNVRKEVVQALKLTGEVASTHRVLYNVSPRRSSEASSPAMATWAGDMQYGSCVQRIPEELTLDALLEMNESKVKETMKRCGARDEECSRLNGALSCLRKVTESGGELKDDVLMNLPEARREHSATNTTESPGSAAPARTHAALNLPKGNSQQARSVSVSTITSSDSVSSGHGPSIYADNLLDPFAFPAHSGRLTPRTPHSITITPPTTPQAKRRHKLKPPRTPPPPCRKVFQLLPNFPALTRSKSHESQLGNRIDDVPPIKTLPRIPSNSTKRFWLSCNTQVLYKVLVISDLPSLSEKHDVRGEVQVLQEHPPAINHLDSSSNPSSTTSSTPSSPAPFQSSNPPSATPPPNPSPMGQRDGRFNFPEIPSPAQVAQPSETAADTKAEEQPDADGVECEAEVEEPESNKSEPEDDEDEVEDLPNRRPRLQGMIYRKPSQTSVYLQEWDIPFEQIELGDPIGQGRWGKVHKGKWHGEVAIRLLEIDGNNQDHLKLFKKEVMNYRQTRHENVVLFMGACMNPPHLAIITSFCKGRTLHSFVRDPKISLDINKTRQIAQEIIKGMGYLHAKGIVHKDLKSKNVFYDNGKVVITDFGLFGISGVVQEGRRENELKLPHDWLCYLAPEIVREMAPGKDEDKLPFSKAADIYAFGTVWYELQAREWPFKNQPAEALIWQIGSGEGVKQVLATVSLGKEVNERSFHTTQALAKLLPGTACGQLCTGHLSPVEVGGSQGRGWASPGGPRVVP
ncbi:Kinase suppressor of Ras 1 [Aix galericulata]|nr:Kinase suppressor of Ras 1 [Aix galericulata]